MSNMFEDQKKAEENLKKIKEIPFKEKDFSNYEDAWRFVLKIGQTIDNSIINNDAIKILRKEKINDLEGNSRTEYKYNNRLNTDYLIVKCTNRKYKVSYKFINHKIDLEDFAKKNI